MKYYEMEISGITSDFLCGNFALGLVIAGLSAALAGYDHGAASGALQNLVHLKGDTVRRRVMNIEISMDL